MSHDPVSLNERPTPAPSGPAPLTTQTSRPPDRLPFFQADSYLTPTPPCARPERLAGLYTSLRFYLPLLGVVIRAGLKAGRNAYSGADWTGSSEEVARLLEGVGCRFDIEGLEHVRHLEGPCVVVGNHMSTLETFVLPALIQPWRDCTFVVKASLLKYPFFKHVLASRRPVVVGRANPRDDLTQVLRQGAELLAVGTSVIVFPQSTRSTDFNPALFNSIGVKLAKRAGVPIIPLALKTDAWSNGTLLKDFGPVRPDRTIHFRFAPPLRVEGSGKEEHAAISAFIQDSLAAWNH